VAAPGRVATGDPGREATGDPVGSRGRPGEKNDVNKGTRLLHGVIDAT